MAQEDFCRRLEGLSAKQSPEQAIIDFLRSFVGPRQKNERILVLTEEMKRKLHSKTDDLDFLIDAGKRVGRLTGRERAVAILYHIYDMSMVEIGYVFGVSESSVSQWLTKLKGK